MQHRKYPSRKLQKRYWVREFRKWSCALGYNIKRVKADGKHHWFAPRTWYFLQLDGEHGPIGKITGVSATWRPSMRRPDGTIIPQQVAVIRKFEEMPNWKLDRDSGCQRFVRGLTLTASHELVAATIATIEIPSFKPSSALELDYFPESLRVSFNTRLGHIADLVVPLGREIHQMPPGLGSLMPEGKVALELKKVNEEVAELVAIFEGNALVEAA